jgi:hypothetical protein
MALALVGSTGLANAGQKLLGCGIVFVLSIHMNNTTIYQSFFQTLF